jgi:hypothetical protein
MIETWWTVFYDCCAAGTVDGICSTNAGCFQRAGGLGEWKSADFNLPRRAVAFVKIHISAA